MKEKVQEIITDIEDNEGVRILYACESGSRAWGFASADSDYDVRFIYLHPPDWYLSINIERKKDVIERPIDGKLDVSGWDLRKALKLFQKSNPPLLEWLGSPIVYFDSFSMAERMRELMPVCYSPTACMYHYFKMAKGNYRDYLRGETVRLKKYFYVLRPVLAVIWLERDLGVVPTMFQKIVDGVVESRELIEAIEKLLELKIAGRELDFGPRIPVINNFLDRELERMEKAGFDKKASQCPVGKLDEVFHDVLEKVWQK